MLVKITLVVAACAGIHFEDVQKKLQELQQSHPKDQVTFRLDKKAACANGQVLTGKEAKLFEALGK